MPVEAPNNVNGAWFLNSAHIGTNLLFICNLSLKSVTDQVQQTGYHDLT